MANDRLYIVDKETKEYLIIAKSPGSGWGLGNTHLLAQFLEMMWDEGNGKPTDLILGTENDDEFYNTYIKEGESFNHEEGWVYYEKPT